MEDRAAAPSRRLLIADVLDPMAAALSPMAALFALIRFEFAKIFDAFKPMAVPLL